MSAPVLSWPFIALANRSRARAARARPQNSRIACAHAQQARRGAASRPALRANPCPEVTDPFCRLPSSALLYRPEAANLGDLMRKSVRTGVRITRSLPASRAVAGAPDSPKAELLCRARTRIAAQSDSTGGHALRSKENAPRGRRMRREVHLCCHPVSTARLGNLDPIPCRGRGQSPPRAQPSWRLGPANPWPSNVHMEPCSTSAFKDPV